MADTGDLKSPGATRAGSTPALGTIVFQDRRRFTLVFPAPIFRFRHKDANNGAV